MKYFDEAHEIWQSEVPRSGQSHTMRGELLRAVEKFRDEAIRNGNINWGSHHERLLAFTRERLLGSGAFTAEQEAALEADLERLADYEHPETDDELYDRLSDAVVEWGRANPGVEHEHDPELGI